MCQFLSLVVGRDGSIFGLSEAEHTDSHEDIIQSNGLRDNGLTIARVEFTPPEDPSLVTDLSKWNLRVDEQSVPSWFDEDEVRAKIEAAVTRHIITIDKAILIGGWWIVAGGVLIGKLIGGNIRLLIASNVGVMRESSNVGVMRGSSKVVTDHRVKEVSNG